MDQFPWIKEKSGPDNNEDTFINPFPTEIHWLINEIERLRRIEDVARSMKLKMNGGVVHIPRDDILKLDEALADNPRPE